MTQITYFQNVWCSNLCFCIVIFLPFKNISNLNDAIWLPVIFTYMYFPRCFFFSQHNFLYSKHHTYDKILRFTIFLLLFSRLRLQRRIIKKWMLAILTLLPPFWSVPVHGLFVFVVFFLSTPYLRSKIKTLLNWIIVIFISLFSHLMHLKTNKNFFFVIFRSPE